MLGKRNLQNDLFLPENRLRERIGKESFYVFLSDHRHEVFTDEDFAFLYCSNNGRESVPPSLIATALLLQSYDRVSDQEATDRAKFDQRWQVALGVGDDEQPFAKSTLCMFRNQLIIHEKAKMIFAQGLNFLAQKGFTKKNKKTFAIDTTPIFGRGAVEDTFNMLAEGLRQTLNVLAEITQQPIEDYSRAHDFSRYSASSFKGTWSIDWDNDEQRQIVLNSLVADCRRILFMASEKLSSLDKESDDAHRLLSATELLSKLLAQDIREISPEKAELIDGVAKDRIISVHDPEMRHGRKSASERFDGHKAAIAVDVETQVIAEVDVLPGNAHDSQNAAALIEQASKNLDAEIECVLGDGAYGTVEARLEADAHNYNLIAPVGRAQQTGRFTKEDFTIDIEGGTVTCPAGETTTRWNLQTTTTQRGTTFKNKSFKFSVKQCCRCLLRSQCLKEKTPYRSVLVHEHEALIREKKQFQRTEEFRQMYRKRVVVEHRLARLVRLGIRNARYFGMKKVLFQLAMAAAVANLTLYASVASSSLSFIAALHMFAFWLAINLQRMSYRRLYFQTVIGFVPIFELSRKRGGSRPGF